MKKNQPDNDAALSRILREWLPVATLAPRFPERVWQRVSRADAAAGLDLWRGLRQWLEGKLRRPAVAAASVAVLMCAGVTAGYWHARVDVAQTQNELQARYVQSVAPFLSAPR